MRAPRTRPVPAARQRSSRRLVAHAILLVAVSGLLALLPAGTARAYQVAGWSVQWMATDTPLDTWEGLRYDGSWRAARVADQGRVVFVTQGESDRERAVVLYEAGSNHRRVLSDGDAGASDPQILGDYVVWVGYEGPDTDIFLHDLSSGETVLVTDDLDTDQQPRLSDRYLVWTRGEGDDVELWAYELDTGRSWRLSVGNYDQRFELGGRLVIEYRYGPGPNEQPVILHNLDTGEKTQPAGLQQARIFQIFGDRVLAHLPGTQGLGLYDPENDSWQEIAKGGVAAASADPSGERVVYSQWTSSGAQIRIYELSSGSLRSIPLPGMAVGEVRLAGDLLLYHAAPLSGQYYGPSRTYAYSLSQGTATELVTGRTITDPATDGERVYWFQPMVSRSSSPPYYYYPPYSDALLQLFVATTPAAAVSPFTDVPATHPRRTAVVSLSERGIVSGYPQSGGFVFRMEQPFFRAQFAKVISLAAQLPVDESLTTSFVDLGTDGEGLYPHDYVAAAVRSGIIKGYTSSLFGPFNPVTRGQLATMAVRAAEAMGLELLPVPQYDYFPPHSEFGDPVHGKNILRARINGLLDGLTGGGGYWDPNQSATRAEAAQVVWNLLKLKDVPFSGEYGYYW